MKLKQIKTDWIVYLILVLISLNPIIWFWRKGGAILDGVDINFPLDPVIWFLRRLFVWNPVTNAGSDFSSSTAGFFFHLIQVIPFSLGFSLQLTQLISLIFWFSLIIFSSYLFSRILIPKRPIYQLIFVTFYSYNIYLFNSWENIKVANLALTAGIPLGLSFFYLLKGRSISFGRGALYSFLTGLVLSGAGINPSYIISFFILFVTFAFAVILSSSSSKEVGLSLKSFLFVCFFIVLANLFWIAPTLNYIFKNIATSGSIDKIGFTNWVQSLSENTSLLNVMRLQGAWDWYAFDSITGLPFYIPYALNYFFKIPFLGFSFLVTLLSILSFVVRKAKKKEFYLAFGLMLILGLFLVAGTYPPTGYIFSYLSRNLPFFTLFRSPWYIFTPLVTLSFAGLVALFLYSLEDLLQKYNLKLGKTFVYLSTTILLIGNFLYSYPLVTGKIFRPGRSDSFYVNFPSYVFNAGKWLSVREDGKVIGYPDDEIERFSWGYVGIESILSLISDSPILFSPLNAPSGAISKILKELYLGLKRNQIGIVKNLAASLNIKLVFEKNDQDSLAPALSLEVKNWKKENFGEWNFYEIPPHDFLSEIYSPKNVFIAEPVAFDTQILKAVKKEEVLINANDKVIDKIPSGSSLLGRAVYAENSQYKAFLEFVLAPSNLADRLKERSLSTVEYVFSAPEEGFYTPVLERYKLEDFGIDPQSSLRLNLDGKDTVWEVGEVDDSFIGYTPVFLPRGNHKITVNLANKNLVSGGDFESEITFEKFGKGIFDVNSDDGGKYLSILNKGEGAPEPAANLKISGFDPMSVYLFQLKYRQIYGNNAVGVISQHTQDTLFKAQTERLPNYPDWNLFSFYFEPVRVDTNLKLSLIAPFTVDPLGTKVLYDDLEAYKVFTNNLIFIKESKSGILLTPKITFNKKSPVLYEGEVAEVIGPHFIVFSQNYSPEWELEIRDENGKITDSTILHFTANSYANGWYVDKTPGNYKIKIFYKPQRLFLLGMYITIFSLIFVIYINIKRNNLKK